ncbi:MAG: sodium/solute symporter [Verrucomicrobiales bacterium]
MTTNLTILDWLVVGVYVLFTFGTALRIRRGQKTGEDYFLAGRRTGWLLIGVSMYATLFSTISFVAVPAEAYRNGMLLSLNSVGYFLFTPLAVWIFLRFFYQAGTFTAYEYLGRRFGGSTRTLGSVIFIIARCLTGAMIFYASAKAFETLVGWPPEVTVLVIGTVTIAYSYIGGMRAIIITDFVQTMVILFGLGFIVFKLSAAADFDFGAVWDFARQNDRTYGAVTTAEFFSFDLHLRYTFWLCLMFSFITPLANYGTDQLVVQRILASSSYDTAKKAIMLKTLGTLPIMLVFYFCGLLLYFYYNKLGAPPPGVEADGILGWFISTSLPSPIPGLIAAALVAALMSSFDSTLNSISTVFTIDILKRRDGTELLRLGKRLTLVWGGVMIGLALAVIAAGKQVETSVFEINLVWANLWGVLLVVMLAGIFFPRCTARGAVVGIIAGSVINLTIPWFLYFGTPADERIGFIWLGLPGWLATAAALAVLAGHKTKSAEELKGLTWRTVVRERDPS